MKNLFLLALLAFTFAYCQDEKTSSEHPTDLQVETLAKSTKSWNDSTLIAYPEGQPEITVLKIDIPPHYKLDLHEHPVINAGVITKGQLTVEADNGQKLHLNEGDALIELVNTAHFGVNETDEVTQIIVFYAGIKDQAITVYSDEK